jgi:succinoglycan biosynthesis protein ExoV
MKVFYYKDKAGNFGDDLNEWIWKAIWPALPEGDSDGQLLVGIGTIIGLKMPEGSWTKLVMGSGVGYMDVPKLDDSWVFFAVRGPMSAEALGLPESAAITDAAAFLRTLPEYARPPESRQGVVFMPHITAQTGYWDKVCEKAGVRYISPRWDSRELLDIINTSELVLADAMHSAICADALRVPWVPLAISPHINTFKWVDWTASLGAPYSPTYLPASGVIEWLMNTMIQLLTLPYRVPMGVIEEINRNPEDYKKLVLAHQQRRQNMSKGQLKILVAKEFLLWRLISPGLKLLRRTPLRHVFAPIDAIMIANAARKLKATISQKRYLSDEAKLDHAVARLGEAFGRLKAYAKGDVARVHAEVEK